MEDFACGTYKTYALYLRILITLTYLPTFLFAAPVRNNLHLYRHHNSPSSPLRLGSMYTHLTRPSSQGRTVERKGERSEHFTILFLESNSLKYSPSAECISAVTDPTHYTITLPCPFPLCLIFSLPHLFSSLLSFFTIY